MPPTFTVVHSKPGFSCPGGSAFFLNLAWNTRGHVELLAPSARSFLTLSAWSWLKNQIQLAHEQNKWGQVKWLFPAAVRPSIPTVTRHLIPFAPNSLHSRARQWLDHPQEELSELFSVRVATYSRDLAPGALWKFSAQSGQIP
jgi:hypothetical protein